MRFQLLWLALLFLALLFLAEYLEMIWTVVQTSWRRLKNNRSELVLTFVVPIIFFSIFAVIFGSRGGSSSGTPKIKVAIADTS
jgi:ABC-2 type transport system permease protein